MELRVLVVRYSALGDIVLTTGPLYQLKKKYPNLHIDLLTGEVGEEIYINAIELEQVHITPKGSGLLDLIKIYSRLPQYDIVLDLQNNFKSHFLNWFVKGQYFRIKKQSKERRAFVKKRKYGEKLKQHVVEKYYEVFKQAFELPDLDVEQLRPKLLKQKITFQQENFDINNAIVIHPYASQKNKEWPYIADLVDRLILAKTPMVIVGSAKEPITFPSSEFLLDLTNKTSIREMSAFIAQSKGLISTDSGPMHLGVGLDKPTVALFGPTTKELGFYPIFNRTEVVEIEGLECRPCHVHGGNICPMEHHNCMVQISVDKVLNAFKKVAQGPFNF